MSTCCRHDFPDKWTWNKDEGRWERKCPGCMALQFMTVAPQPSAQEKLADEYGPLGVDDVN